MIKIFIILDSTVTASCFWIKNYNLSLGLSVQRLLETWRHKALLLFKLLLLRRRVVFYGAQAGPLSATLLALVSLLPQCLDHGLTKAANVV